MASLIFVLTLLTLLVLTVRLTIKLIRNRPARATFRAILFFFVAYSLLWLVFKCTSKKVSAPLATDVCFDDWCATVTQIEKGDSTQSQFSALHTDSTYIILHARMSNHARGIAQKPSEPRIHVLDSNGNSWACSSYGQNLFEKSAGKQADIGMRLELGESHDTKLVYAVPANAKGLTVLIEEGPAITKLLFPGDQTVFSVK